MIGTLSITKRQGFFLEAEACSGCLEVLFRSQTKASFHRLRYRFFDACFQAPDLPLTGHLEIIAEMGLD